MAPQARLDLGAGHFIRAVVTLGVSRAVSWVGAAALTILLPRYLGAVDLGKYTFVYALVGLVALLADLGTSTYVTKEISRDPRTGPPVLTAALGVRLTLSVLLAIATALAFHLLSDDVVIRRTAYILVLALVVGSVEVTYGALQGLHRMRAIAISNSVGSLVLAGLTAALLLTGRGAPGIAMAGLVAAVCTQTINAVLLLRHIGPERHLSWARSKAVLRGGLPFFAWNAALTVYAQIDIMMLTLLTNVAVVGWYSGALRIASIPAFIPVIVVTVVFPALSASSDRPEAFNSLARRAVKVVLVATLPMSVAMMLLPDRLTTLLGYPPAFVHSWWPIVLLGPNLPLMGFDMVLGTILTTRDRQRQWALAATAAAALNPMVNLLAIPLTQRNLGNGAIGAAAVTTLTEAFMMAVGLALLPRGVLDRSMLLDAGKAITAALAMAAAVAATRGQPLPVPIALGVVTYCAGCRLLGLVRGEDVRQVRLHLGRRVDTRVPVEVRA